MKRFVIAFLILVAGFTAFHLFRRATEDAIFTVKFHVYQREPESPSDILFRRIPNRYDGLIKVSAPEPYSRNLNLYKVENNIVGATPDIHYLLYDKTQGEITELRSRFLLDRILDSDGVNQDTIDSYCVNLSAFNRFFTPGTMSMEAVADKYALLLANDTESTRFRKVRGTHDIDEILASNQRTPSTMVSQGNEGDKFQLIEGSGQNEFIYWYYDRGLIRISLHLQDGQLIKVKTKRVGKLGVESSPL